MMVIMLIITVHILLPQAQPDQTNRDQPSFNTSRHPILLWISSPAILSTHIKSLGLKKNFVHKIVDTADSIPRASHTLLCSKTDLLVNKGLKVGLTNLRGSGRFHSEASAWNFKHSLPPGGHLQASLHLTNNVPQK